MSAEASLFSRALCYKYCSLTSRDNDPVPLLFVCCTSEAARIICFFKASIFLVSPSARVPRCQPTSPTHPPTHPSLPPTPCHPARPSEGGRGPAHLSPLTATCIPFGGPFVATVRTPFHLPCICSSPSSSAHARAVYARWSGPGARAITD